MEKIYIQKKNGTLQKWDVQKLLSAVNQSAVRARGSINASLTDKEQEQFVKLVTTDLESGCIKDENGMVIVKTNYIHMLCEKYLEIVAPDVGKAYSNYHSYRMDQAKIWERVMGRYVTIISDQTDKKAMEEKNQNANADSTLASTKKCFVADYTAEAMWEHFFLTEEEKQILKDGYIYAHDKNGRSIYAVNCCVFRAAYVLEHGCELNGVHYNKPTSLSKAFDVLGDLILMTASQQYGGFTIPRIDSILVPYAELSYQKYLKIYNKMGITLEAAQNQAYEDVKNEMYDGFQGLEIKLNTVASSRGDYPFTTITFGLETTKWGKLASIAALETRAGGQGEKGKKKPVLFPKLVFLYDENLHGKGKEMEDVFEAGIYCSSKTMYPDWLSLTGEGYVPSMYKKYGKVISPMGCRAFLSPWYEKGGMHPANETDVPIFEGRFNVGVFTLNLPMILAKSRKENQDFYELLDYYLNIIRNMHKRTYENLSHMKASCNPVGFCYGGFLGGHLQPEDSIKPILKHSTASFGITALNELEQLYHQKSLHEDGSFALEVMQYINKKINEFKYEDNILYAIYGTPAEKLCGTQVQQFRELYGIVKNVSDRTYVSNSFHDHVTEDITPIQKQDDENRFWDYFNGGKIQYCKYPVNYNIEAMKALIRRAMKLGLYEGVNLDLCYCDDCGYQALEIGTECPKCGSVHITQINRMNGYLSFTRIGKDTIVEKDENGNKKIKIHTRFGPAKFDEINDRKSM